MSKGFTSLRAKNRSSSHYLAELVGPESKYKFGLRTWDGRSIHPIIDSEDRVFGICAGVPKGDETWQGIAKCAACLLEQARGRLTLKKKDKNGCWGKFTAVNVGISHGGGQPHPRVLEQSDVNKPVLDKLMEDVAFKQISGFATGAFSTWAPWLYQYQEDCLSQLLKKDHELRRAGCHPSPQEELCRNWPKMPWAATAFNFGPRTVCYPHADYGNLAFRWCCIIALGDYDYTKGGHLVLWDLKLVIEFPAGATILIPSSAVHHSNTHIGPGELHYSVTQYSSGGLFHWVHNGFMASKKHQRSMEPDELAAALEDLGSQLQFGLSLYSTIGEIEELRNVSIVKGTNAGINT